jgi:hypothetical protein
VGSTDDQRVQRAHVLAVLVGAGQFVKQVAHGVQARALLAIALDHGPRDVGGICLENIASFASV